MLLEETVYSNGDSFIDDLVHSISRAQYKVHLEAYIFDQDSVGNRVLESLARAAERDVQVRLLIDGIGSAGWTFADAEHWRRRGIDLKFYHALPWQNSASNVWRSLTIKSIILGFSKLNQRNHRKICIIDDETTFISSMNISARHVPSECGPEAWRDTSVRLMGHDNRTHLLDSHRAWSISQRHHEPSWQHIKKQKRNSYAELLRQIRNARERIWITNPYFIPDFKLTRTLCAASKRGVDVKILLPSRSDVPGLKFAMQALYSLLLGFGVSIYEYRSSILHAKVMIIDDWISVGSYNLDYRSIFNNLEVSTVLSKPENILLIQNQFNRDLNSSQLISLEAWKKRSRLNQYLENFFLFFKEIL